MQLTPRKLIIVPTYNEMGNIEKLVDQVCKVVNDAHILFVDDNSQDGTREFIEKLVSSYSGRFYVIKRPGKMGLGTAYLDGFRWALTHDYAHIVQMDADLSHQPKYLPEIFEALQKFDFVIGSRYVKGGGVENWSLKRRLLSRGGSLYARTILGVPMRDFTGGFNGWRASSLERIGLDNVKSDGYCFQIEMKYRAANSGLHYTEIPIIFPDRTVGQSKMSFKIMLEAILRVWSLRFRHRGESDV